MAAPAISGVSSTTNYAYLVDSLLDTVTDPAGRITSFSYDVGGRTQRITQPDPDGTGPLAAAYTDILRDGPGNVLQSTDALGHATNTSYDAWFRPLTTTDPDGNVTSRTYDAFGNLLSVTDPLNNLTEYSYNKLNQLVSQNKRDGATNHLRSYSYDGVGNLRSMLDRNGRTTEFAYDNLYRVTSETWKTGGTTSRTLGYSYDTSDRLTGLSDSDSLATDFQFVYDDRGQLQLERQLNGLVGTSVVFDRDFDTVGNRTKLEANFGGTLSGTSISGGVYDFSNSYAYDAMHRLTSVTQTSRSGANVVAPKLATFSYNAASQLTDVQRYSATTPSTPALEVHSRWGYDSAGRLTSLTHGKTEITAGQSWDGTTSPPASLGASNTLAAYFFDYDQANRLTDFSSYQDAFKTSYSYDNRDQLTAASSAAISGLTPPFSIPSAESYNLDAGGNRKSTGGASQSAPGTHNRLQTDGTYNYSYDNEGNTTRRTKIVGGQVTEYTRDNRNRLASVTDRVSASGVKTQQVEYFYDAFNQLTGKRVATQFDSSGNVTNWSRYEVIVWADGQEVFRFVDSDGQGSQPARIANRYLWGEAVDQLLADEQYAVGSGPSLTATTASSTPGNTLWALTDHLGSVRDLVDNNGVIREHNVYDSFGRLVREVDYNTAGQVISSLAPAAVDTVFGYTGRLFDPHTGLQYNRERWYDPATGRWLSQDPIGFAAGDANLYRYVGNETTKYVDPDGLEETDPALNERDPRWWKKDTVAGSGLNPWSWPLPTRFVINWLSGYHAAERESNRIERARREHDREAAAAAGPNEILDRLAQVNRTKHLSPEECAQAQTFAEAGIEANATLLGGAMVRPSGGAIWSSTRRQSGVQNAYGHWKKHGGEFPHLHNAKEYVDEAWNFLAHPPTGTLRKTRSNGEIVLFDPATDTFAVYLPDGTPKTMFKPDPSKHGYACNLDYFNAQ